MHMATSDQAPPPTSPEMGEYHMSIKEESQFPSSSVSHGQIDGNTDAVWTRYVAEPQTPDCATVQGMAKLREVLNDPGRKIAYHIRKTSRFNKQLASNEKCKKARKFLTGDLDTPMTGDTVPFILAIWCMLGGHVPSMWRERVPGENKGPRLPLTDWGKRMIEELDHLGAVDGYEFDICQAYAIAAEAKTHFNWNEAVNDLLDPKYVAEQAAKNPKRNAKPASPGKHGVSSPRQSPASKRRKNVEIEIPRPSGGSYAGKMDTEDEGHRGEVGNGVMYGGSKQGLPASEAPSTKADSNRGGFQRPEVPRNSYRDQDDAPSPFQKTRALPGTHLNQGPEGSLGNDSIPRLYRPGLKEFNMSPDKTSMGRKSHGRKEDFAVERPTAPGVTTGMLSPSYRNATASSGEHRFRMPSALQQSSTASSSRNLFEESASVNRGSAKPHVQVHSALEHPSGADDANMMNDAHFGDVDDDLLPPSQRGSMPGHRQNTLQVTKPVSRGSDTRDEEFVTASREDSDRRDEAVSNRNESDASFPGAQPGDLGQDDQNRTVLSTRLPTIIGQLKDLERQNDKELSLLRRNDKAKDAKIAALQEEASILRAAGNEMEQLKNRNTELEKVSNKSRQTAGLLNRTSALTLLRRAIATGKELGTISLAELLHEMDGDDGTGASGAEGS